MRTEITLGILALIGLAVKFAGWAGGGFLLTVSLLSLSLVYLLGGFYFFSSRGIRRKKLITSILFGLLISHIPLGILFKIQHWQGAGIMLLNGIIFGVFLTIISFILKAINQKKEFSTYFNNLVIRTTVLTIVTLTLWFTP